MDNKKKLIIGILSIILIVTGLINNGTFAEESSEPSQIKTSKEKVVFISPAHGGKDTGAIGANGMIEKNYVLGLSSKVKSILENNYNVTVKMARTMDKDVSLDKRADMANAIGADLFVSLHCNSFNGEVRGFETFIYERLENDSKTFEIQDEIHEHLMNYYEQFDTPNRGQKQANFVVLRETIMPAIIVENLFIDNEQDFQILTNNKNEIAKATAEAIAKAIDLKEIDKTKYRVLIGSFKDIEKAKEKLEKLENAGFNGVVVTDKL